MVVADCNNTVESPIEITARKARLQFMQKLREKEKEESSPSRKRLKTITTKKGKFPSAIPRKKWV